MRTLSSHVQGLSLLVASMVTYSHAQDGYTYSRDGPCGALAAAHYTVPINASNESHDLRATQRKLRVTVTLPAQGATSLPESKINRAPPYPVIIFLNGFLVRLRCALSESGPSTDERQGCTAAPSVLLQQLCSPTCILGLRSCAV